MRVCSFNICGSGLQGGGHLSQAERHTLIAEELLRHAPDVLALQEVFDAPHQQELESKLAAAGYRRVTSAPSHCGSTVLYLHSRLCGQASSLRTARVGPAAVAHLVLGAPPDPGCEPAGSCGDALTGAGALVEAQEGDADEVEWGDESDEEAQLQAALAASLHDAQAQAQQPGGSAAAAAGEQGGGGDEAAAGAREDAELAEALRLSVQEQRMSQEEMAALEEEQLQAALRASLAEAPRGGRGADPEGSGGEAAAEEHRSKRQRLSPPRQQQQQQQDDLPAAPPAPEQPAQQQQQQPLRLYLAGCHLAPFAEGAQARLAQLQALVAHAREQGADVMIVAGDLNMRNAEEPGVEVLGLQDAHHTTGRQRANRFTWDSATNRFNGPSCPQYNARYDRILYRGDGLAATQLTLVASEPVRGDKQEPESAAYLSDHFGICATLDLPHGPWKRTHLGLELGGRGADG